MMRYLSRLPRKSAAIDDNSFAMAADVISGAYARRSMLRAASDDEAAYDGIYFSSGAYFLGYFGGLETTLHIHEIGRG